MATTISVNKQCVYDLLKSGKDKPFIIPEYQRPYAWSTDQIEALFEDIWEFSTTIGGLNKNEFYYLGSIVSFENDNCEQEIIDGQQRMTSLFLLLRAIYTKLTISEDSQTAAAQNFIRQIEPAIWRTDNMTGEVKFSDILLKSLVVDNKGNEILKKILETGHANLNSTDNYSKNYLLFQKLYDEKCKSSPLHIYDFIYSLLHQAIILPISADNQETALTIFSTLNNRGLPLSDADIFKAKIYNYLKGEEKDEFVKQWKSLEKEATEVNESIQQLFYYYMFFLRAKDNDTNSTTPGVRKYYSANKSVKLYDKDLMPQLKTILNLWKVINSNHDIPEEKWDNNKEIRKALDILTSYPNEFWKYPVIIYYLSHRTKENFEENFLLFLNRLTAELITKFIMLPTINAVKSDILKLNASIINNLHPSFEFKPIDKSSIKERIILPHRNIIRMLLKVYAYNHQTELLADNWQIEHILPQKWQPTFFTNESPEHINEMIEHIGNKTPFERKLNIIASNGYFAEKQKKYAESEVDVTKILTTSISEDWTLGHITNRDELVSEDILGCIKKWDSNYSNYQSKEGPSLEELELIQKFKEKGWL